LDGKRICQCPFNTQVIVHSSPKAPKKVQPPVYLYCFAEFARLHPQSPAHKHTYVVVLYATRKINPLMFLNWRWCRVPFAIASANTKA